MFFAVTCSEGSWSSTVGAMAGPSANVLRAFPRVAWPTETLPLGGIEGHGNDVDAEIVVGHGSVDVVLDHGFEVAADALFVKKKKAGCSRVFECEVGAGIHLKRELK